MTGANGSGKSTLLSVLTGALAPDAGTVQRPGALRIGHLAQDEALDPGATARSLLLAAAGRDPDDRDEAPELFGLIHPRELDRPLGELSRGQVRRAVLAALLADPPELLVLDEPTNHLALDLAVRLEDATQHWPGTVIVASHDRWLRRRWQGRTLALEEG
ncbi:ATP-binding cassette domain-containing protein [Brachybacterium nesterenkovii]|uniref:ATP-binding cassette domain-containing protein n=1 Tax=Brachybacterium nesterenkovii TaxID=47847 RepID=UPI002E0FC35D